MLSRRLLLGGAIAALTTPALAEVIDRSPRPVPRGGKPLAAPAQVADAGALLAAAKLTGATGFVVADAATGTILEQHDGSVPLPPASVTKAVTALYALEHLGAGRRFQTRVLATGAVQGGMVQGDLVLVGGGDPTLQTDQLGDLTRRLAQAGLKGATGRFLYWEGALPQLARVAEDQPDHVGYNPAISGLNLNFNRVHFEWKRAGADWTVAMDARGERFVPQVGLVDMKIARRESPLFTYAQSQGHEAWTVAASALGKGGSRWLPVRQPGLYLAEVFRTLARAQGVTLPEAQGTAQLPQGTELGRVDSEALPAVLQDMLRFSTNLTAECSGLAASGQTRLAASGKAMTDWARARFGIAADFVDHSGLGGQSRITAAAMVRLLAQAHRDNLGLKPILRDVGMKDDRGKVVEGHPVRVLAKSGTLNFVSGLAGHITPPGGREMVFAIFSGDPDRRDAVPVDARENPAGAKEWTARARRLQGQLISRWAGLYA